MFGRRKKVSKTEAMALIAEAISRSLGKNIDDTQLAVGLAMCEQVDQPRSRKAKRIIDELGPYLDQDWMWGRSLTAAFPVIYHWLKYRMVAVMVASNDDVRTVRVMLKAIQRELGTTRRAYGLRGPEESLPMLHEGVQLVQNGKRPLIVVGTYESLAPIIGVEALVLVVRSSPDETEQVARLRSRRMTALPEPP